jgi:hypothetical protein
MQPTYNPYAQHPQAQAAYAAAASAPTATQMEQKIYIPNDLVGCIIGKGGVKINEIRQLSQCMIKITEPGSTNTGGAENERLVVITGASHNIQMAVSMLYNVGVMSELLVEVTDRPFAASWTGEAKADAGQDCRRAEIIVYSPACLRQGGDTTSTHPDCALVKIGFGAVSSSPPFRAIDRAIRITHYVLKSKETINSFVLTYFILHIRFCTFHRVLVRSHYIFFNQIAGPEGSYPFPRCTCTSWCRHSEYDSGHPMFFYPVMLWMHTFGLHTIGSRE